MKIYQKSFAGGIISSEFFGQILDAKYQIGLKTCENFIVQPHGSVRRRTGFKLVKETKDSSKKSRLIGFVFGYDQTFVIEMGEGYFRFHTNGSTLKVSALSNWSSSNTYNFSDLVTYNNSNYYCLASNTNQVPTNTSYWYKMPDDGTYEVPNDYLEDDLFSIHKIQSLDVITLTHKNYPPRELRRYGSTNWQLVDINFEPSLDAPTSVTVTPYNHTTGNPVTYYYKVTAVNSTDTEESYPSISVSGSVDLEETKNYMTITWSAVSNAGRYNVYRQDNGLYGYIGQTDGLTFKDDNITPDISITPPQENNPFNGEDSYPATATYFQQRRVFANTNEYPYKLWMTRTGTEKDLSYSIPLKDDDAISFNIKSDQNNKIQHFVPLQDLIVLTDVAEWYITSVNSETITPSSISSKFQSGIGSSSVPPVVVNSNVIFFASRGGHVRELAYSNEAGGFMTGDMSLRCHDLFDGKSIVDRALQKSYEQIVWMVSSDGSLLGLTYIPEQQVSAWHKHTTSGAFESVCCVPEDDEDFVYCIIKRTINGVEKRFVERMSTANYGNIENGFFVDCGGTYDGTATKTISGLDWLEGETVSILADGAVMPEKEVVDGVVTIDKASSLIHIGLPYNSDLESLPLTAQIEGYAQARTKNISKVYLKLYKSRGVSASGGQGFDKLRTLKPRYSESYGSPPNALTGEYEISVDGRWSNDTTVCIRQKDPLPLNILAMTIEAVLGG